jgi:phospholipase C
MLTAGRRKWPAAIPALVQEKASVSSMFVYVQRHIQRMGWSGITMRCLIGATALLSACSSSSPTPTPTATSTPTGPIKHIVFFIKENRTFDNYFGTYPGANGATTAMTSTGQVVPLQHEHDQIPDIDHSSNGAIMAYDGGKMDKFNMLHSSSKNTSQPYGNNSLTQLYQSDIPDYWTYARQFVLGDNMFSSLMGPSFPNHLYTIAGQSGGVINNPVTDGGIGSVGKSTQGWGCDVPNQQVQVKDSNGNVQLQEACFNFMTLADELDAKGYSWRYYAPPSGQGGYIWSTFDAIKHIRYGPDWKWTAPHSLDQCVKSTRASRCT